MTQEYDLLCKIQILFRIEIILAVLLLAILVMEIIMWFYLKQGYDDWEEDDEC